MILVADIGNTNLVFGVYNGDRLAAAWRHESARPFGADALKKGLAGQNVDSASLEGGIIASVVPKMTTAVFSAFEKVLGRAPLLVGEKGVDLGIAIRVDKPEEVGADRLLNAIAAGHLHRPPLVVVDFGTATTFDVVGPGGAYLGGAICPGIHLSVKALHQGTAKLPLVEIAAPRGGVTGKNTQDAIRSGIFFGYLSLIEGIIARFEAEHGAGLKTIATGGLAGLFAPKTKAIQTIEPNLTLLGLRLVYERNPGKS